MPSLRSIVRYGYAPFMMFGMTGAAYWVVSDLVVARGHTWAYLLLVPLLVLAYAIAFASGKDRAVLRELERSRRTRRQHVELPAHHRLRVPGDGWRAADPGDLLAVPVPGHLADAVADVGRRC